MNGDEQSGSDANGGKELPDPTDEEIVQLMAAQQTVMDNHEHLDAEYKANIRDFARRYGVDHFIFDDDATIIPDEAADIDDR